MNPQDVLLSISWEMLWEMHDWASSTDRPIREWHLLWNMPLLNYYLRCWTTQPPYSEWTTKNIHCSGRTLHLRWKAVLEVDCAQNNYTKTIINRRMSICAWMHSNRVHAVQRIVAASVCIFFVLSLSARLLIHSCSYFPDPINATI